MLNFFAIVDTPTIVAILSAAGSLVAVILLQVGKLLADSRKAKLDQTQAEAANKLEYMKYQKLDEIATTNQAAVAALSRVELVVANNTAALATVCKSTCKFTSMLEVKQPKT